MRRSIFLFGLLALALLTSLTLSAPTCGGTGRTTAPRVSGFKGGRDHAAPTYH